MQHYTTDLAGFCPTAPSYLQTRQRINYLVNRYLSIHILSDRLTELPSQFTCPQTRPWERIHWQAIQPEQIIGIAPTIFLQLLAGAAEIETPIRAYSQESWNYTRQFHPQMAFFMGGDYDAEGALRAIGIWEKEERQHAPAFSKMYQQLTGEKLQPKTNSVTGFQPTDDPWNDMRIHLMMRISSEWGAISTYLWLMTHSTRPLQK
jgi:hypothetical protein